VKHHKPKFYSSRSNVKITR